jgi:hypothetical protein
MTISKVARRLRLPIFALGMTMMAVAVPRLDAQSDADSCDDHCEQLCVNICLGIGMVCEWTTSVWIPEVNPPCSCDGGCAEP